MMIKFVCKFDKSFITDISFSKRYMQHPEYTRYEAFSANGLSGFVGPDLGHAGNFGLGNVQGPSIFNHDAFTSAVQTAGNDVNNQQQQLMGGASTVTWDGDLEYNNSALI